MHENSTPDLFQLGQRYFGQFLAEVASYGIVTDPAPELRRGKGLLCYYSLEDRNIYLSVPDLSNPAGRLQALFLRSMLGCETNQELFYFFRLFLPHIIAHELAHYLRHSYGMFSGSMWHEEQIANKLAVAVVKHRLSPQAKDQARQFLRRAVDTLAQQIEEKNIAVDSYYSVLHALNVSGQVDISDFENIEMLVTSLGASEEMFLESGGQLSDDILERLEQRGHLIAEINEQYASDQIKYIYYHLGWLYLDLNSRETEYIDEFARNYLNLGVDLLPSLPDTETAATEELQACYRAYQDVSSRSEVAARYFYKRYRSLLLSKVEQVDLSIPGQTERLKREARLLLENWSAEHSDTLDYLSHLAPPSIQPFFPHRIADSISTQLNMPAPLPTETDRRLWLFVTQGVNDVAAANTLQRLAMLDQTDLYRPLPPALILELARKFSLVKYAAGETVLWQGEYNDDVYFLLEGRLEVLVTRSGQQEVVNHIRPGEMFGEIAFFTEDPRSATVRALEASRCFVLTDADLQLMSFNHPPLLMRMASALAKRLVSMYEINRTETV